MEFVSNINIGEDDSHPFKAQILLKNRKDEILPSLKSKVKILSFY